MLDVANLPQLIASRDSYDDTFAGQQLEILISWAAHDWAGRPWDDEWQPITYLKRQRGGEGDALYVKARALEAAKYATRHAVVREEGGDERRSPRLAEAHVAAA